MAFGQAYGLRCAVGVRHCAGVVPIALVWEVSPWDSLREEVEVGASSGRSFWESQSSKESSEDSSSEELDCASSRPSAPTRPAPVVSETVAEPPSKNSSEIIASPMPIAAAPIEVDCLSVDFVLRSKDTDFSPAMLAALGSFRLAFSCRSAWLCVPRIVSSAWDSLDASGAHHMWHTGQEVVAGHGRLWTSDRCGGGCARRRRPRRRRS